ncbi:MAG TPA: hypothetical protein VLM37_08430, partial [Fibrobacteraceae bacterium]|nr:hypothetical protein [Fibrobacteraceae bacterium]
MTRFALSIPSVALALCLCACSFSDKDDSDEDSSSSGTSSSSLSSSSAALDSSRMEITYVDTLSIGDTLAVRIPDSIALDSSWNLYLGTYPAGSILKLSLQSSVLDSAAQFRVRAELQGSQLPIDTLPDGSYAEYMTAGNTSFEENSFVLLDSGYYYLEVTVSRQDNTQADSVADFQIYYSVDSAYYQFVGGEDSVQLPTSEYIQGCFRINEAEDSVVYFFHASEGNRLTLVSGGENFASMTLRDSQDSLLDSTTTMRLQLLPEDSTLWYLKLRTETPSWNTGNYAFFSLHLDSVALGLGEYFAAPDTLAAPGDTVDIDWSGSASSGWDVRHDHYLYLGELSA